MAAPAFAHFGLPLAGGGLPASLAAAPPKLELRIDGWESPVDSASDLWVRVNSMARSLALIRACLCRHRRGRLCRSGAGPFVQGDIEFNRNVVEADLNRKAALEATGLQ